MRRRTREADPERLAPHLKGKHLAEPPAATLHKAIALRSRLPRRETARLGFLATLLFDSLAAPLPAGVRGSALTERRLLYRLEDGDGPRELDLLIRIKAGKLELAGQFLPPIDGATVAVRVGRSVRRQPLGETGDFLFRAFPAPRAGVALTLELDGQEAVVIEGIALATGAR
jgi:hypothetical protein